MYDRRKSLNCGNIRAFVVLNKSEFYDGQTWSEFSKISLPKDAEKFGWYEPHAIETEENRLLVTVRVQSKETSPEGISLLPLTIYSFESVDGGKSYSDPKPMDIIGSPPHLYKTTDGKIILSYGRREMPMGIRAKISKDKGKTWGEEIILIDDATHIDLGYPSTTEIEKGKYFTCNDYVIPEFNLSRVINWKFDACDRLFRFCIQGKNAMVAMDWCRRWSYSDCIVVISV